MTEAQAKEMIKGLTTEEKRVLLDLLKNLDSVKDAADAYQTGTQAGKEIRKQKEVSSV